MDKTEYLKQKTEIVKLFGKPEYDPVEPTKPVNESARRLKDLFKAYQSESKKKQALEDKEQKEVVKQYRRTTAVPIDLSDNDLEPFTKLERDIVVRYFQNTNLTPGELETTNFSRQKIVALMRSGPFAVLAARVFEHLMPIEVRNAALKAVRDGDKRLIERFAEQTGVLKQQEQTINVNKPIEDPELLKKLKELGDNL